MMAASNEEDLMLLKKIFLDDVAGQFNTMIDYLTIHFNHMNFNCQEAGS